MLQAGLETVHVLPVLHVCSLQYCNQGTLNDAIDRGWLRTLRVLDGPPDMRAVLLTAQASRAASGCSCQCLGTPACAVAAAPCRAPAAHSASILSPPLHSSALVHASYLLHFCRTLPLP
jgi:hypothetical protein